MGRTLVDAGLAALRAAGIAKCHLLVFEENESGRAFWDALGATRRDELRTYSITLA